MALNPSPGPWTISPPARSGARPSSRSSLLRVFLLPRLHKDDSQGCERFMLQSQNGSYSSKCQTGFVSADPRDPGGAWRPLKRQSPQRRKLLREWLNTLWPAPSREPKQHKSPVGVAIKGVHGTTRTILLGTTGVGSVPTTIGCSKHGQISNQHVQSFCQPVVCSSWSLKNCQSGSRDPKHERSRILQSALCLDAYPRLSP